MTQEATSDRYHCERCGGVLRVQLMGTTVCSSCGTSYAPKFEPQEATSAPDSGQLPSAQESAFCYAPARNIRVARSDYWEWKGLLDKYGYGKKSIGGLYWKPHRLAWAWANWSGEGDWKAIPAGKWVLHRCDNPRCVNPGHLFLGTGLDNVMDCINKGRNFNNKKTHCRRGHEYDYINPIGGRECRTCRNAATKRYLARKRSARG